MPGPRRPPGAGPALARRLETDRRHDFSGLSPCYLPGRPPVHPCGVVWCGLVWFGVVCFRAQIATARPSPELLEGAALPSWKGPRQPRQCRQDGHGALRLRRSLISTSERVAMRWAAPATSRAGWV